MLVIYQKRSQTTDMASTEKRMTRNEHKSNAGGGAMALYAVVNRNRDSMVSYSANDGDVKVNY